MFSRVLKNSYSVFLERFPVFLLIALGFLLPSLYWFVTLEAEVNFISEISQHPFVALLFNLLLAYFQVQLVACTALLAYNTRESLIFNLSQLRGRGLELFGVLTLFCVTVVVGFALFLIPGLILMVNGALFLQVYLLEGKKTLKGTYQRSKALIEGHRLYYILFCFAFFAANLLLSLPGHLEVFGSVSAFSLFFLKLCSQLLYIFYLIVATQLFVELRRAKPLPV